MSRRDLRNAEREWRATRPVPRGTARKQPKRREAGWALVTVLVASAIVRGTWNLIRS